MSPRDRAKSDKGEIMTLKEVLKETGYTGLIECRVNIYLNYRQETIDQLFGYCGWDGEKLISRDGDSYSLNDIVKDYYIDNQGVLTIYYQDCIG